MFSRTRLTLLKMHWFVRAERTHGGTCETRKTRVYIKQTKIETGECIRLTGRRADLGACECAAEQHRLVVGSHWLCARSSHLREELHHFGETPHGAMLNTHTKEHVTRASKTLGVTHVLEVLTLLSTLILYPSDFLMTS